MITLSRALRLWLAVAAGLFALAVVVAGLRAPPENASRLARSDCTEHKERKRHDWGWNVFNNRTDAPDFRPTP